MIINNPSTQSKQNHLHKKKTNVILQNKPIDINRLKYLSYR